MSNLLAPSYQGAFTLQVSLACDIEKLFWVLIPINRFPRRFRGYIRRFTSGCTFSCYHVCFCNGCGLCLFSGYPACSGSSTSVSRVHFLDRGPHDVRRDGFHACLVVFFDLGSVRRLRCPHRLHLRLISMVGLEGIIQSSLDCIAQRHQVFTPEPLEEWHTQEVFQLRAQQLIVALLTDRSNAVLEL